MHTEAQAGRRQAEGVKHGYRGPRETASAYQAGVLGALFFGAAGHDLDGVVRLRAAPAVEEREGKGGRGEQVETKKSGETETET